MKRSSVLPFALAGTGGARGDGRAGDRAAPFALAYAGVVVLYMPLLALLLPLRVAAVAGDARFGVLTVASVAGAIVAASTNILFGWASDRRGTRRGWVVAGLVATLAAFALVARAATPAGLVLAVMAFQAGLNLLLGPLLALIAEEVADARKGRLAGLMAGAQPAAALLCPALVAFAPPALGPRLAIVGGIAAACLLPLLLAPPRRAAPPATPPVRSGASRRDLGVAWAARSLFQVAGSVLFAFLPYVMERFASADSVAARVGGLLVLANLAPLPVALLLGRWSDAARRRKPVLLAAATLAAAGLAVMALATGWTAAALGFCLYSIGGGAFLSLQTGFAMELLPDPRARGRDLGLLNLANTLPILIGPVLAWRLASPGHVSTLLLTLAALSLAGGITMQAVRGRR